MNAGQRIFSVKLESKSASGVLCRAALTSQQVELLATDGQYIYESHLTLKNIDALVRTGYEDNAQWRKVFSDILLDSCLDSSFDIAAKKATHSIQLSIREELEVPIKISTLKLEKTEEVEVNLFEWLQEATRDSDGLRKSIRRNNNLGKEQEKNVQQARDQLNLLRERAEEHEKAILRACCDLINTKKRKIRQLQTGKDASCEAEEPDRAPTASPAGFIEENEVSSVADSHITEQAQETDRSDSEHENLVKREGTDDTTSDEEL